MVGASLAVAGKGTAVETNAREIQMPPWNYAALGTPECQGVCGVSSERRNDCGIATALFYGTSAFVPPLAAPAAVVAI